MDRGSDERSSAGGGWGGLENRGFGENGERCVCFSFPIFPTTKVYCCLGCVKNSDNCVHVFICTLGGKYSLVLVGRILYLSDLCVLFYLGVFQHVVAKSRRFCLGVCTYVMSIFFLINKLVDRDGFGRGGGAGKRGLDGKKKQTSRVLSFRLFVFVLAFSRTLCGWLLCRPKRVFLFVRIYVRSMYLCTYVCM